MNKLFGYVENLSIFIAKDISEVIHNSKYEKVIVQEILDNSKRTFPSKYQHFDDQSKGEPDFKDLNSEQIFDVKLVFTKDQGKAIGSKTMNVCFYGESIAHITNEIVEWSIDEDIEKLKITSIYKIVYEQIGKIKENENLILLFTYPITLEYFLSITDYSLDNALDKMYRIGLKKYFENRRLFFIYPTLDNFLILKDMTSKTKEAIKVKNYFKYFRVIEN